MASNIVIKQSIEKLLEAYTEDEEIRFSDIPELIIFKELLPDQYEELAMTKGQIFALLENITSTVQNNRTLPIKCTGPECKIRHICPFDMMGIAPVGKECALERVSMDQWRAEYVQSMKIDYRDKVQMSLVDELVEIDIFNKYRFPAILSENVTAFQEKVNRFSDRNGQLIESRKEVAKAFEAKMMMAKRREVIMRELLATPKQKAQHKLLKTHDPSKEYADLSHKFNVIMGAEDAQFIESESNEDGENS